MDVVQAIKEANRKFLNNKIEENIKAHMIDMNRGVWDCKRFKTTQNLIMHKYEEARVSRQKNEKHNCAKNIKKINRVN